MAVHKWSVSIEEDLASRVEQHVGSRGSSGFVARAVDHELEGDALASYLAELDDQYAPSRPNWSKSSMRCGPDPR